MPFLSTDRMSPCVLKTWQCSWAVQGEQRTFYLTTQETQDSPKFGQDGSDELEIQRLWTVEKVNASSHSIPTDQDIRRWPHLQDINLPGIDETKVDLIMATKVTYTLFVRHWDGP